MPEVRKILELGLEAFAELGYDGASARELAQRLGVSHAFINDRYGSKLAFWKAVVDATFGAQLRDLPPIDVSQGDEAAFRNFVLQFYRGNIGRGSLLKFVADESSRDSERLAYLLDHHVKPVLDTLLPLIERLQAQGKFVSAPLDVIFTALIGPLQGIIATPVTRWLSPSGPDIEGKIDILAAIVADGLLRKE